MAPPISGGASRQKYTPPILRGSTVAHVSLPRATSGTSGTNGNVAVFQNRIMVMNKKRST